MKLLSPLPQRKARIEIIPLIDIMFFLLACMMLVSLNMIQMRGVKLNLPTAASSSAETHSDLLMLSVRKDGVLFLDKTETNRAGLAGELRKRKADNPELRVMIQGDVEAFHGDVLAVLDLVRLAGVQKVTFQTKADTREGGILGETPAHQDAAAPTPR